MSKALNSYSDHIYNSNIDTICFNAAITTFYASAPPDDNFILQSLSCNGYNLDLNISQCSFTFYTKDSTCSDRYAAGLHCEGRLQRSDFCC